MQRLFTIGLGFAVVALCALPALAEETAAPEQERSCGQALYNPDWYGIYSAQEQDGSPQDIHQGIQPNSTGDTNAMVRTAQSLANASAEDVQLCAEISAAKLEVARLGAELSEVEFSVDSLSASSMAQKAQLDCLGEELARGCQDWDSPFSGQITYRMQFSGSGLQDLGSFQQGVRFDLRYREWLSDNLIVNLEIGSANSDVFDIISGRHGSDNSSAQINKAYIEGHFGER